MKYFIIVILLSLGVVKAQNVGVGTTTPTHTLHISSNQPNDPIRIEGLKTSLVNDTMLLITDTATGIIHTISIRSLGQGMSTDIDSASFLNDTLYLYENNKVTKTYIATGADNDWNINANGTGLESAPAGDNYASGDYAIAAGQNDTASGDYSVISGGEDNKTTGSYSSVVGGYQNKSLNSLYSTIGGFRSYLNNANYSIAIGYLDSIIGTGNYMTLLGGEDNKIVTTGRANSILGGIDNEMFDAGSYIRGGTILGGINNRIISTGANGFDRESTIVGGGHDTIISSHQSVIAGGLDNKLESSLRAGMLAGFNNKMDLSARATIVGGLNNTISSFGIGSSIIGGDSNTINNSAALAIILAGEGNVANNFGQAVLGHYSTSTVPLGSIGGGIDPDNIIFKIGNGTSASVRSNAMVVKANGNVGIGQDDPDGKLNVYNYLSNTNNTETPYLSNYRQEWEVNTSGPVSSVWSGAGSLFVTARLRVAAGQTATGVFYGQTIRMQRKALGSDDGTMASMIGLSIYAGNEMGSGSPITNSMIGLDIAPRFDGGTINTFYGLRIGNASVGTTTVGSYYGVYQSDINAINYFNGKMGIGVVPTAATVEKLTVFNGTTTGTYTTTGWAHSSDKRLKTNITSVQNALEIVNNLEGVYYNWKNNEKGKRQVGFIAQDVQKVLPEVVLGNVEKGDTLKMIYQNIVPVLVEAVKEQQKIIEKANSENKKLKERLEKLEKAVEKLLEDE